MIYDNPPPKRPVPLARAARWIGVQSQWLAAEAEAGRLPALKAGTTWLFDLAALERALLARVRDAGETEGVAR